MNKNFMYFLFFSFLKCILDSISTMMILVTLENN
jgi:hypothetical protein